MHMLDDNVKGRHDYEFCESYRLNGFDGTIKLDEVEVSEAKFVTIEQLKSIFENKPESITPWFRTELTYFASLPGGLQAMANLVTN